METSQLIVRLHYKHSVNNLPKSVGSSTVVGSSLLYRVTINTMSGKRFLYVLSKLFYVVSLVGIVALIISDIGHKMALNLLHQRLDAWPLISAGISYIALQFATDLTSKDRAKGVFLGCAFLLWGGEQILPPSRIVTVMDEGAVAIFVIDITTIVWGKLNETHDQLRG